MFLKVIRTWLVHWAETQFVNFPFPNKFLAEKEPIKEVENDFERENDEIGKNLDPNDIRNGDNLNGKLLE